MYCDTQHFFEEQYTAFLEGRNSGSDPSKGWYKGEIWFFDNYSEFLSDLSFAVLFLKPQESYIVLLPSRPIQLQSFRWPRSSKIVESLEFLVMNTSTTP